MSYEINGKLHTDNPLLDELVYNAKLLISDIVLKDPDKANNNETEESLHESDIYMSVMKGNIYFELFDYTYEMLEDFSDSDEKYSDIRKGIDEYSEYNDTIPDEYREPLMQFAATYFIDNYEEQNEYYRKYNGLPPLESTGFFLEKSDITEDLEDILDTTTPIHNFNPYQITIIEQFGILSRLQTDNPDLVYLHHLGANKVDIFTLRNAEPFECIYLPQDGIESLVYDRFKEILDINRLIYTRRHYSQAYKFNSDYYNEIIILLIIAQSVTDLIVETPEWYIRRDIFDIRTVEYILTANGVEFYSEIPLKYQISLVHMLNLVVKYKSCNKNIYDLASIFKLDNATVYKYHIMKSRKYNAKIDGYEEIIDINNELPADMELETLNNIYELIFIKVPIGDSYDKYVHDNLYLYDYENVVYRDWYWDSVNDHDKVKLDMLRKDFTVDTSKYLEFSVKYSTSEFQFQLSYMLGMIMNTDLDLSALDFKVTSISRDASFGIRDLFVLLYLLSFYYYTPPISDSIEDKNKSTRHLKKEVFIYIDEDDEEDYDGGYSSTKPEEYAIEFKDGLVNDNNPDNILLATVDNYKYQNDPYFEDLNISTVSATKEHDTSEDTDFMLFSTEKNVEGGGTIEMSREDYDGGYSSSTDYSEDCDGGSSLNTYVNIPSGTRWYRKPSKPYLEPWYDKEVYQGSIFKIYREEDYRLYPDVELANRVYGFNLYADMDYLADAINIICPKFNYDRGYTLEDFGVEDFVTIKRDGVNEALNEDGTTKYKTVDKTIMTADDLLNIYFDNQKVFEKFTDLTGRILMGESDYYIIRFVYNYLFTTEIDHSIFGDAETYSEYLKEHDIALYTFFKQIIIETDTQTKQQNISEFVDDIIASIDAYLGSNASLRQIFYFVPAVSWSTIISYLALLIEFFKSYKTQFLEIGGVLDFDNQYDNYIYIRDNMPYYDIELTRVETFDIYEKVQIIEES